MKHFQLFTKRWPEKLVTGLDLKRVWRSWWQKVPHLSSWSGESRREKRRESGASCRWEEKPCCLSHLQVDFLCHSLCIMNKVCMKKCHLWTQEFHSTKFITNDHNNSFATYSMMYFKIYEVFQIDYPEKIRRKVSFFVDVSSEIFHTGWFFSLVRPKIDCARASGNSDT